MHQRKSNFELLRIVSMFCILIGHYVGKGGIVTTEPSLVQATSLFFWGGGKLGVNCFVLLTGYFAESVKNEGKKAINLWCRVLFYVWLSLGLYVLFAPNAISIDMLKQTVFPLSTQVYWFVTNYILLCMLKPFINMCILRLNKKQYEKLLIILLIAFTVVPTLIYKMNPFFSNIGWFICLYCIGYYIKRHMKALSSPKAVVLFGTSWCTMWVLDIILELFTSMEVNYFSYMYRIPMLVASFSLFCIFRNIDIGSIPAINKIAEVVLGVYLLHDCLFFRNYFWNFARTSQFYGSFWFLVHAVSTTIFLFAFCGVVDKIREELFKRILYKTKIYRICTEKLNEFLNIDYKEETVWRKAE